MSYTYDRRSKVAMQMSPEAIRLWNDLVEFPSYRGQSGSNAAKLELKQLGLVQLIERGADKDPLVVLSPKGKKMAEVARRRTSEPVWKLFF